MGVVQQYMSEHRTHSHEHEKETTRLETFSDAIFAIALTLLVLDIKIPEAISNSDMWVQIWQEWPIFLSYFLSFLIILIMWVNHHHLFRHIRKVDNPFLYINGLLLMFISLTPFPTSLLAEGIKNGTAGTAAIIYCGNAVLIGSLFFALWKYASCDNRLLDEHTSPKVIAGINKQYRFGPLLYIVAFIISFWSVSISIGLCLVLALFFAAIGIFSKGEMFVE
jgi:uncharacterized membrane protein